MLWIGGLKKRIEAELGDQIEVIWPHEIASGTPKEIFETNLAALRTCPLMVSGARR